MQLFTADDDSNVSPFTSGQFKAREIGERERTNLD